MITGECPYEDCKTIHLVPIADKCPAFTKETCDGCDRDYWMLHSRVVPEVFTVAEFDARFVIEGRTIKEKEPK